MSLKRTCLGWKRPFSSAFADRLEQVSLPMANPDELLVWVPSIRAARHLLNELLTGNPEGREGLHPPSMVTPARFLKSLTASELGVATELQCLQSWKEALTTIKPETLVDLFPVLPRQQRVQWAYSVARQMYQVRTRLAMEDHTMGSICRRVKGTERERWNVLSQLETAYRERLSQHSLEDPNDFLRAHVETLLADLSFERVLVAGVLNLSPLEARCLETFSKQGRAVELYLPVPVSHEDTLDDWGRPLPEEWSGQPLADNLLENRIHRAAEPRELVRTVLDMANGYDGQVEALVVGSPDEELAGYLVERSRMSPTPFYAPIGQPLTRTGFGRLLLLLEDFKKGGRLSVLREMFHNSLFRDWVVRSGMDPLSLETDLLSLQEERFLFDLPALSSKGMESIHGAGQIRELVESMESLFWVEGEDRSFPAKVWQFLQHMTDGNPLNEASQAVLGQLEEILQDLLELPGSRSMGEEDSWELLRYCMENQIYYPERSADQRPVSGWLELPWEPAPHLVILGLPDMAVPGTAGTDTFLSPGLCLEAGLRTPEMESAYHACRLRMILESRRDWGRVDILLFDRGMDDSPSLPSRFLFNAPEEQLLNRVHLLLDEKAVDALPLPVEFGCQVRPPVAPELRHISVTDFKAYLANPFSCYLERRMHWRAPEPLPRQMDPFCFGSLAHKVLELFNKSETGRSLHLEKDITEFLDQVLEDTVTSWLGSGLSLPLQIQVNVLRQRLHAAVPDMARSRSEGWVPVHAEWATHKEEADQFEIAGIPLHGVIDLIERKEGGNQYRVIDYKTTDSGHTPVSTHLVKVIARTPPPLFSECEYFEGKKTMRWLDLQLPLYQMIVQKAFGGEVACAYFNLAKAVKDVGLREIQFSEVQLDSARACAEAIVERIRAGDYPYIDAKRQGDPWVPWFGQDNSAVDPDWGSCKTGGGT